MQSLSWHISNATIWRNSFSVNWANQMDLLKLSHSDDYSNNESSDGNDNGNNYGKNKGA